jgi:hypothetical protein
MGKNLALDIRSAKRQGVDCSRGYNRSALRRAFRWRRQCTKSTAGRDIATLEEFYGVVSRLLIPRAE